MKSFWAHNNTRSLIGIVWDCLSIWWSNIKASKSSICLIYANTDRLLSCTCKRVELVSLSFVATDLTQSGRGLCGSEWHARNPSGHPALIFWASGSSTDYSKFLGFNTQSISTIALVWGAVAFYDLVHKMIEMRYCNSPDWKSVSGTVIELSLDSGNLLNFSVPQFLMHWWGAQRIVNIV